LSNSEISILTLVLTFIAAVAGIIAAVPQIPAIRDMFTKSKAQVEFKIADDGVHLVVNLSNLKKKQMDDVIVMLVFSGVQSVDPTNGSRLILGVALGSAFFNVAPNVVQATVKRSVGSKATVGLGGLRIDWLGDNGRSVEWFVYVNGGQLSSRGQHKFSAKST